MILDLKKFVVRLSTLPSRPDGYALAARDLFHAKVLHASIGAVDGVRILVPIEDAA